MSLQKRLILESKLFKVKWLSRKVKCLLGQIRPQKKSMFDALKEHLRFSRIHYWIHSKSTFQCQQDGQFPRCTRKRRQRQPRRRTDGWRARMNGALLTPSRLKPLAPTQNKVAPRLFGLPETETFLSLGRRERELSLHLENLCPSVWNKQTQLH